MECRGKDGAKLLLTLSLLTKENFTNLATNCQTKPNGLIVGVIALIVLHWTQKLTLLERQAKTRECTSLQGPRPKGCEACGNFIICTADRWVGRSCPSHHTKTANMKLLYKSMADRAFKALEHLITKLLPPPSLPPSLPLSQDKI